MNEERQQDIVDIGAALDALFTDFALMIEDPDWRPEEPDAWQCSQDNVKIVHDKLQKLGVLKENRELVNVVTGPTSQDGYLASPCSCPACGSSDAEAGSRSYNDIHIFQDIFCNTCGASWTDTYELKGYSELSGKDDGDDD